MESPIKEARLSLGLTQSDLAYLAHMSPQAVMRYEQGLYEAPSMKLVRALAYQLTLRTCEETSSSFQPTENTHILNLKSAYTTFRLATQASVGRFMRFPPELHLVGDEHPFLTFRKAMTKGAVGKDSRASFCILLALHPAVVAEYDSGRCRTMPALIKRALSNTGLEDDYIKNLDVLGEIWYDRHN